MGFRIASEKTFRIASDLGVCDSNRIAHRGCIARFGPLSPEQSTPPPPRREKNTKIIRPEYFYVILGGGYGKITQLPRN